MGRVVRVGPGAYRAVGATGLAMSRRLAAVLVLCSLAAYAAALAASEGGGHP